jgi:hypothetical protein
MNLSRHLARRIEALGLQLLAFADHLPPGPGRIAPLEVDYLALGDLCRALTSIQVEVEAEMDAYRCEVMGPGPCTYRIIRGPLQGPPTT